MAVIMTERPSEQFLTIEQVMERLQVSRSTVRNLMREGKLRYKKVGRIYRIQAQWLQDYINAKEQP